MKFIIALLCLFSGIAYADTSPPQTRLIYNSTSPTLSNGQTQQLQGDSNANLFVDVAVQKAAINANASISSQSVATTEGSIAAPANAVSVFFESDSTNTGQVRWGFSNSSTAILSSTTGPLMEPGRDVSLNVGTGTYLHLISLTGTNAVQVVWTLSK